MRQGQRQRQQERQRQAEAEVETKAEAEAEWRAECIADRTPRVGPVKKDLTIVTRAGLS